MNDNNEPPSGNLPALPPLEFKIIDLHRKAHRAAFAWYIRKGYVPSPLPEIMNATASLDAFIKYNEDEPRVPAGSGPASGEWTGGGSDAADNIDDPPLEPVYPLETALTFLFGGEALVAARESTALADGAGAVDTVEVNAVRSRLESLLAPGGEPIGDAGRAATVRVLPGGADAAEKFLQDLTEDGTISTPIDYEGVGYKMPDGSFIGYRPESGSGEPTIDVNVPSLRDIVTKLKFLDED